MRVKLRSIPFMYKLLGSVLLLVVCFVISMLFGAQETAPHELWLALTSAASEGNVLTLQEIRLPRELAAMLVGAALAVSGAIMQGVTRNPLADPGLLGLTSGANLALAVIFACIPGISYFGIMLACFIGAAAGGGLVVGLGAVRRRNLSPVRIVLAGAAISTFLQAATEGISLAFKISKDVSMWTAGGLIGTNWEQIQAVAPVIVAGIAVSVMYSGHLTILSLSDEVAVGLGQSSRGSNLFCLPWSFC